MLEGVCSAKDNNKFASCGGDKSGYLWDVATGKMIRKYFGHEGVRHVRARAELVLLCRLRTKAGRYTVV